MGLSEISKYYLTLVITIVIFFLFIAGLIGNGTVDEEEPEPIVED